MKRKKIFLIIISFAIFFAIGVRYIFAQQKAILYIEPDSGIFKEGEKFKAKVMLNTQKNTINSARGVIIFQKDKLEVLEIEKENSIFSFWDTTTSFSNNEAKINFGGGLPSPGFSGSNGEILEITFRAKLAGKALVDFKEGAVLANDKEGTDVLGRLEGAEYNTKKTKLPTPKKKPAKEEFLKPPKFTAYPDELSSTEVFYAEGTAEPKTTVILYIESEEEEPIIKEIDVDSKGSWSYVHNKFLQAGEYNVYAKSRSPDGEISPPSEVISINVARGGILFFGQFIKTEVIFGIIILVLFAAVIFLLIYFLYDQQRIAKTQTKLMKEIKEANDSVVDGFGILKAELSRELDTLKDVKITEDGISRTERVKRQKLINDLVEDLDLIEKVQTYIRKEVKDIEKTLPPIK